MRDIRDLWQEERSHRDLSVSRMDHAHLQNCHVKEKFELIKIGTILQIHS